MIEEPKKKTPGTVVVLGALWLVAAAGNLVYAVCLIVLFGVIRNFTPGGADPLPPPPPAAVPLYWAFQHYVLVGSVQGALALLGIYSGVQFLRLRPWARGVLEAGGWAIIGLCVVLGVWLSQFWRATGTSGVGDVGNIAAVRLFSGLLNAAFFAAFPIAFVWLLRSRLVRMAFVSGGGSVPPG